MEILLSKCICAKVELKDLEYYWVSLHLQRNSSAYFCPTTHHKKKKKKKKKKSINFNAEINL